MCVFCFLFFVLFVLFWGGVSRGEAGNRQFEERSMIKTCVCVCVVCGGCGCLIWLKATITST